MSQAIRDVYGSALLKYGAKNPDVVVLDADVSGSTKSAVFGKQFPNRFYNCGISEYAMVGMASGMAINGKIPFVNTFAVFLTTLGSLATRAFLSYSKLNVKLIGSYGGLSDSYDGASHHALEDIAVMRALPNMTVLAASDELITDWMVKTAIDHNGPMYIRLSRNAVPLCHVPDYEYHLGKGIVVREGTDASVIACGIMVGKALEAADILLLKGISIRVIDMFTIKPLDEDIILKTAQETKIIITAEEHSVIGGLGSAVAEVLAKNRSAARFDMIGVNDCHTESGSYSGLLEKYGLDAGSIAYKVIQLLNQA